jgi:hypothetical protein
MEEDFFRMLSAGSRLKRSREKAPVEPTVPAFSVVPPLDGKKELETWRKAYSVSKEP